MAVGNATVTVGGGTAILTLPDVEILKIVVPSGGLTQTVVGAIKDSDDFGDEIGWNVNGSIVVPMTGRQGRAKQVSLSGFWARIEDNDSAVCTTGVTTGCMMADPTTVSFVAIIQTGVPEFPLFGSTSDREVDHWDLSLESKWWQHGGDTYKGTYKGTTPSNALYFVYRLQAGRSADQ